MGCVLVNSTASDAGSPAGRAQDMDLSQVITLKKPYSALNPGISKETNCLQKLPSSDSVILEGLYYHPAKRPSPGFREFIRIVSFDET